MADKSIKRIVAENVFYAALFIIIVLAVWSFGAYKAGSDFILPYPHKAAAALWQLLGQTVFWKSFGATLLRTAYSFLISFAAAAVFAFCSALVRPLGKLLSPLVAIVRALPTMAVVLLLVIWTSRKLAPVIVSVMVVFPVLYAEFYSAIKNFDASVLEMCKVYGVKKSKIILGVYIPVLFPEITVSSAAALSLNVKLMVAAEVLAGTYGSLGGLMQQSAVYYETATLMALTVLSVAVAMALEVGFKLAFSPFFKWKNAGGRRDDKA